MTQTYNENVVINGSSDDVQLTVEGHSTQTEPLQQWQDSSQNVMAQVTEDGRLQIGDTFENTAPTALIEVHRDAAPGTEPTQGLSVLATLSGAASSALEWVVHKLSLVGTGGVSSEVAALRAELTHNNSGDSSGADLRAGSFEVVNQLSDETDRVGEAVAVRAAITNEATGYLNDAVGIHIKIANENPDTDPELAITNAYGLKIDDLPDVETNQYAILTNAGNIVFNEGGDANSDFRVEGDTEPNLLFVDASVNRIGVGTENPDSALHVVAPNGSLAVRSENVSNYTALTVGLTEEDGTFGVAAANGQYSNLATAQDAIVRSSNSDLILTARSASGAIRFGTQNPDSEKMTILSSGNVGIGDASPDHKLDVAGITRVQQRLQVTGNTSPSTGIGVEIGHSGTEGVVLSYDRGSSAFKNMRYNALSHEFEISGSNAIVIDSNGDVGIGTTTPNYPLDVAGIISAQGGDVKIGNHPTYGANYGAVWRDSGDYVLLFNDTNTFLNARGTGSIYFREDNNTLMTLTNGGNLGIGITPSEKLHVNGSIRGNQSGALRISTGNGWTDIGSKNSSFSHFYTDRGKYFFDKEIQVDTGYIGSYNENLSLRTAGTNRVTVLNSNGYVGIGDTTPSYKLDVQGQIRAKSANHQFILYDTDSGANEWSLTTVGNSGFGIYENASTARFNIVAGGNIGIGDSTPSYKLDVNGDIRTTTELRLGGTTSTTGAVIYQGGGDVSVLEGNWNGSTGNFADLYCYDLHETSDISLKQNIRDLGDSLDQVRQLKGRKYNRIDREQDEIGLVAQEVELVIPEVVSVSHMGTKAISYTHMIPLLIEAIKELADEVDTLKTVRSA